MYKTPDLASTLLTSDRVSYFSSGRSSRKKTSVADPGCLSQIPDPDFLPFRIPDPKTATSGVEKNLLSDLFCSDKFHKIENYFIFLMLKKIIWASFQRIIKLFTQKFVTKL
jgi:hypothetical protein